MTSNRIARVIIWFLVTLGLIYVAIIALHIADKTNDHEFLYFSEAAVGIGIIFVFILLVNRANFIQLLADKDRSALDNGPFEYALYDLRNKVLTIQPHVMEFLGIKDSSNDEEFLKFFSDEDAEDIRSKMHSYSMIESFSKTGLVKIDTSKGKFFFNFWCNLIKDQLGNKHIAFWFHDITKEVVDKIDLVKMLQKYRIESFKHLSTLEVLPFPVWYKDSSNQIVFKNKSLVSVMKELEFDPMSIKSEDLDKEIQKKFLKNGMMKTYKFKEIDMDFEGCRAGFAFDVTDLVNTKNNMKSIEGILDKLIDNLTIGFLVLDKDQRIINYNAAFQNLFVMETATLSQKPHYRYILDILREKNMFPELKGYKEAHLAMINTVRDYSSDLLHIPDGKTVKLTIIPSTDSNTILIYENITPNLELERELYNIKLMNNMVLNFVHKPVVIFDIHGKSICHNSYFFESFMKDTELEFLNVVEVNLFENILGINLDYIKMNINKCMEERKCAPFEVEIKGEIYVIDIHALYDMGAALIFAKQKG